MIRTFKSHELEKYYVEGDATGLPFTDGSLIDVGEILIDLDSTEFDINDFKELWTVNEYEDYTSATVTVNNTEPAGAIIFSHDAKFVFNVDYFCEG